MKKNKPKHTSSGQQQGSGKRKRISNVAPSASGHGHGYGHGHGGGFRKHRHKGKQKINLYEAKIYKGALSSADEDRLAENTVNKIALQILIEFDNNQTRADILLRNYIRQNHKLLTGREKGNLSRTVMNVLKWRMRLDYYASKVLKADVTRFDPLMRNAYRLATLNATVLSKSLDKCIALSDAAMPKEHGNFKQPLREFLKTLVKAKSEIPLPSRQKDIIHALAIIFSHPAWLIERWIERYGPENTEKLCEFNNEENVFTIRVNTLKSDELSLMSQLKDQGFSIKKSRYGSFGFYVSGLGEIYSTNSFKNGFFEIQDEASQLFVEWCNPKNRDLVLDVCAGSGGKTIFLSALMNNTGKVIATDTNAGVMEDLAERIRQAGCSNVEILHPDVAMDQLKEKFISQADKVIIDAPCSGLGTLSKNPDIKWRLLPEDIGRLAEEQKSILEFNSQFVAQGGELIYATCTINPEENEQVVEAFLSAHSDFEMIKEHDPKYNFFIDERGYFYILPFKHNMSGFFGCKLKRVN
ncbi:16S rRNA (cytosine(967)-C(5))-methyltransferase RsmB [bacterium]|nr:16S rRNA (cytosine(967)-C(5))-methyltransferase RsmB [bacterium]